MPLAQFNIRPGFNKQTTPTGAENQYIDGDFVRFRKGLPEKIGGWRQLTSDGDTLVGAARAQHTWADLDGRKYAAIGTNKVLVIYYEGAFYDITPLEADVTGATFDTTNGDATVTVNKAGHGLARGDLFKFTTVTAPPSSGYTADDFTTNVFQVIDYTSNDFTIEMPSNASGTTSGAGSATIQPYVKPGPINQVGGYGWGTVSWSGKPLPIVSDDLNGAITDSATTITLTDASAFPSSGTILIEDELITYTGKSTNDLTGCVRGTNGTTAAAHADATTVEDATNYVGWGQASGAAETTLPPGIWSLTNYGQKLIATISNNRTFEWDPINTSSSALETRATVISGAPTASTMTLVSDRDRHIFHLGTETTIGTSSTRDPMFIRFSDQETTNVFTPTATNTAGTFRLDDGTEIRGAAAGKDYVLVLTNTAAYTMQFVGPPFTFSLRKVGSNCGLIGRNALAYVDGAVYWMGAQGGFFVFDGTVKALPCTVEDFVFTTGNTGDLGINYNANDIINAGINNLYNEINWFYCKQGSTQVDRVVTYNFDERIWSTGSLNRTSWEDASLYDLPYATEFVEDEFGTFPVVNGKNEISTDDEVYPGKSFYYAHETGDDEVLADGSISSINAFIQTGDIDLKAGGEGEYFLSMSRFFPDFKKLVGQVKITLNLKNFPQSTEAGSTLSPFTITASPVVTKVDTRARGRYVNIKIENDDLQQSWRYGTFTADIKPDGRR